MANLSIPDGDVKVLEQVVDDAIEVSEQYVAHLDEHTLQGDEHLPAHLANAGDAGEHLEALRRISRSLKGVT